MTGPRPPGHWAVAFSLNPPTYRHLRRGRRYRVVLAFRDFDGDDHPVGETWTFLGYDANAYHDGLSLFVSVDGAQEWQIRLSTYPGDQDEIVRNLADYVDALGDGSPGA